MNSVREFEIKKAIERKKLMQVISQYLNSSKIKAGLIQEPALESPGVANVEPVIQLKEQRVESIRLIRIGNTNYGDTGDVLRFQYRIKLEKELPAEFASRLKVRTKTIKEGKVLGLFGGKIVGVKWTGQGFADILNQDKEISEILLHCAQIWEGMELIIGTKSLSEIYISGPCFRDTVTIASLYSPGRSYEEQNCVFGYGTIERIAEIIQKEALDYSSLNKNAT